MGRKMHSTLAPKSKSRYIRAMFRLPRSTDLLAAVVLLFVGCAEPPVPPPTASPDLEGAEADVSELLGKRLADAHAQPSSGLMRGRLAMALDANGFATEAAETYKEADALDETDFRWPYFQSLVLAGQGQVEAASERVRHALTLEDYAPARLWLATWLLDMGDLDGSEQAFTQILTKSGYVPFKNAASTGLARIRLRQEQPKAALALLEPVVRVSEHPYPRRLLVRAARAAGQATNVTAPGRALAMNWPDPMREQLQAYVRGFGGRLIHAEALIESGNAAEATELLEAMRDERPEDRSVLNNLAVALLTSGRTDTARAILEAALPQHDDFHLLHFNLAGVYETLGDFDRAVTHFDRAIELQPGLLAAHERKVAMLVERQQYEAALEAIAAARDQGRVHSNMLFFAGIIEATRGNWLTAVEQFQGAIALDDQNPRAQLFLARSLAEAARFDEANEVLEIATALGASAEQVRDARTRIAELQIQ